VADSSDLGAEAQAVYDAAPCGLMRTTPDGTFLRVNRTFCGWAGLAATQLVGRRKFQDLLTVGGRIFHQTHWAPLLTMQGSISEVKLELRQADGATVPVVVNAIVQVHGGVKVHELAAYVARDRDKYERELLLSRRRLEELVTETTRMHELAKDRALFAEQMIGIVSHDLRNPVSTIQMGAALLARGVDVPGHDRLVARIVRASQRADRLISDLLDFTQARLGAGLRVTPEPIELHALVSDAVAELALAHPERVLRHVSNGTGECRADPARLEQLLGNLVSNAMVYGAPGAPVTVSSWIEESAFGVSVHNHGPAIPPNVIPTLFQPMTRGTKSESARRSVGLGLFIVSEIMRAHGGQTQVDSSAESGTSFCVLFGRTP
jgi:phosphoserine phosphatase RsbU/P